MFISFCIISIGDKPDKLRLSVESIHRNFTSRDDYEIIIVGNNIEQFSDLDVTLIEDNEYVEFLGKRRNIATNFAKSEILVHCDEDLVFPKDWYINFQKYNNKNPNWQVLGNKVLLPDGTRYWDRNIYFPYHVMVDYDYNSISDVFYQSGCFGLFKRSLLNIENWDDNIPFYGTQKGFKHNEDVEFSIRLHNLGIKLSFDKNNLVWHNDFSYLSNNQTCNKNPHKDNVKYKSLQFILDSSL